MKKQIIASLLSILLIAVTLIPVISASAEISEDNDALILGDADGDGEVTILDATRIQRYLVGLVTMTDEEIEAADADEDGELTILDATAIQRWLAGYETTHPVGEPITQSETPTQAVTEAPTETPTEAPTEAPTQAPTEAVEVTGDEWKENTGVITLSDSGITVTGDGIYVDGNTVIITEGGDWEVTGSCSDGMIYINTGDEKDVNDKVKLRLNGMSLTDPDGPAIYFDRCKKAFITLESGTVNTVSDGSSYASAVEEHTVGGVTYSITATEAKGAIHTDDTLEIKGKGTLNVNGNYKHGINSDDDISIENGVFNITSVKDGIHVNDAIAMDGKSIKMTVNSSGDGIESEGTADVTLVNSLSITAGGKGIKAEGDLTVTAGTITVTSDDDCIHSNGNVTVNGGALTLTSSDDGIHADSALTINDGAVTITQSYEGLEGNSVLIEGGVIDVTATDDGINAAGGNDQSSIGGRPGQNNFNTGSTAFITVNGGEVYVTSSGDGIDSNGALSFNGGVTVVQGPSTGGNFSLDADGTVSFTGGTVVALCSSNAMWEDITRKNGNSVYNKSIGTVASGSTVCVTDSSGNVLAAVKSKLSGNLGIVFYSASESSLSDVRFVTGGTYSGSLNSYGYGSGGTVSGGTSSSPSTSGGGYNPGGPGGRW